MKRLTPERRILLVAWLVGLPGSAVALILLWTGDFTSKLQWTLTILIVAFWFGCALNLRSQIVFHLRTLANLLAALREGDYSLRARKTGRDDAWAEVLLEANTLGDILRKQRLAEQEATSLLQKVMAEIDVAVFVFDREQRLRLANQAGQRLLAQPVARLAGHSAEELGLAETLAGEDTRTLQMSFPGGLGRWSVRRSTIREGGLPHHLLVLTDLSRPLREEERKAWQRLVRVLGHELNNSLAPIKSVAGSLASLLGRQPRPPEWESDVKQGLRLIAGRAESLTRFMEAYAQLARLPPPEARPLKIRELVQRVVNFETRQKIEVVEGPEVTIRADGAQMEQLLINLLHNAVDAAQKTRGKVRIGWSRNGQYLDIHVEDEGPGLPNTTNLFVPFFTTKPGGTGIGLVLSRQIAEAHGGTLTLENRRSASGCEARVRLPFPDHESHA